MAKVARLQPVSSASKARAQAPLPKPVVRVRDEAASQLVAALSQMLYGADDILFDMAESEQEANRNRYFDAMRELRLQREALLTDFSARLAQLFQWRAPETPDQDEPVNIDQLGLVNDDDLEISVALDSMAQRVLLDAEQGLQAFAHRLSYLSEGRWDFAGKANPLDPRRVAGCFAEVIGRLELDIQARLVVLKLFERQVFVTLPERIEQANQQLADAGVLPDYQVPAVQKKPRASRETPVASSEPTAPTQDGAAGSADNTDADADTNNRAMFGLLQELLSTLRGGALGAPLGGGGAPHNMAVMHNGQPYLNGVPVANPASVHPVNSGDLMSVLSRLQRLEENLQQADAGEHRDVRENLSALLDSEHGEGVHALDKADDDVINLVSLLFDFILDDEALPSEIKALIGRLQIPLLKVAISDKSFFSNEQHAARALLNALARAGNQWDPRLGIEDELYQRINSAVHRVIEDYEDDAGLFDQLLAEFEQYFQRQSDHYQRVEQRTCEAEEGQARAAQAREAVVKVLDQRLAGRNLPAVAVRVLRQGWQQLMYLTWLREGEQSEAWQQQVKAVDAVVWSVLEHREQAALEKLKTVSPRLLKRLQAGLREINFEEMEIRQLLGALHLVHKNLLKGLATERVAVAAEAAPTHSAIADGLPEDHFLVRKASELPPGQWITVDTQQGPQRAKLAANIRHGVKLIFTNRRGVKTAEFTAYQLAVALNEGTVKLLEEGALFDRALQAVIGDLRRRHADLHH